MFMTSQNYSAKHRHPNGKNFSADVKLTDDFFISNELIEDENGELTGGKRTWCQRYWYGCL
ncbi:AIF_collapsed_G0031720.mRNA.1.CDS.1 [Saccharomyces cerevisiae]|nr:AIF_collapsed_G0031720.mRNA.1.CDS.1 [Saccharomyces cerevisiae]